MGHHPSPKRIALIASGVSILYYVYALTSFIMAANQTALISGGVPSLARLIWTLNLILPVVGAFAVGAVANRIGKELAFALSLAIGGAGAIWLAIVPSFDDVGSIQYLGSLSLQLFAQGGVIGVSGVLLFDQAPVDRRCLYTSFLWCAVQLGLLAAEAIARVLPHIVGQGQPLNWTLRGMILAGACNIPLALFALRILRNDRSREVAESLKPSSPRPQLGILLPSFLSFSGLYAAQMQKLFLVPQAATPVAGSTLATAFSGLFFAVLGGWLGDRVGRKSVAVGTMVLLTATIVAILVLTTVSANSTLDRTAEIIILVGLRSFGFAGIAASTILASQRTARATVLGLSYSASSAVVTAVCGPPGGFVVYGDVIWMALFCFVAIFSTWILAARAEGASVTELASP